MTLAGADVLRHGDEARGEPNLKQAQKHFFPTVGTSLLLVVLFLSGPTVAPPGTVTVGIDLRSPTGIAGSTIHLDDLFVSS